MQTDISCLLPILHHYNTADVFNWNAEAGLLGKGKRLSVFYTEQRSRNAVLFIRVYRNIIESCEMIAYILHEGCMRVISLNRLGLN